MATFSALLAICAGNSPVSGEVPAQRPVTRSFDVFFDLRLNKRLNKQSWGWWFETLSRPLWRQCNEWRIFTPNLDSVGLIRSLQNCAHATTAVVSWHAWNSYNVHLTHWGRATHICVGKLTIIGSDNGLSPGRRQAIIWTNAGMLLIRPWGTNFSEIFIGNQIFSFKKMHLKISSAKWRPVYLGLNVLIYICLTANYNFHQNWIVNETFFVE